MRTIEPGQQLTYQFTAEKAGVWMYHCSTMPMSAHIAAGMTGAVVIEPSLSTRSRWRFGVASPPTPGAQACPRQPASQPSASAAAISAVMPVCARLSESAAFCASVLAALCLPMSATMESAITREKSLKKWNRIWKLRLIEQSNLEWRDLLEQLT